MEKERNLSFPVNYAPRFFTNKQIDCMCLEETEKIKIKAGIKCFVAVLSS
jgi:hypothetical protein